MRPLRLTFSLWLVLGVFGVGLAAPPTKWTVTVPDTGTYSYWVQGNTGAVAVLPTTITHKGTLPLPPAVTVGDTLYVLDAHTGQVAVHPLMTSSPVTLMVADFKPVGAGIVQPPAPAPKSAPTHEGAGNGIGQFFSWLFGLAIAGGVLWFLRRLYLTRGEPLIALARRAGIDVPDPKPLDPNADAPLPLYEAPKPRPVEKVPDDAGIAPPPRSAARHTPSPRSDAAQGPLDAPQLVGTQGLAAGSTFALTDGIVTIGRDGDNGIVLAENTVSRRHARLVRGEGDQVVLIDEESANGIFVNGARVPQAALVPGDEIKIGDNYFRFEA